MRTGIATALIFLSFAALAQNDKIFLKNGSRLKGKIENKALSDSIRLSIESSTVFIPLSLIEEIHLSGENKGALDSYRNYSYSKGFHPGVNVGLLFGGHSSYGTLKGNLLFEILYEYRNHPFLNVALSSGINEYDNYLISPLFLQYKAIIGRARKSLFLYGRAGYGFILNEKTAENYTDTEGGRILGVGVGYQTRLGKNFLSFNAGYHSQRVTEEYSLYSIWSWPGSGPNTATRTRTMNRMIFSVGYLF